MKKVLLLGIAGTYNYGCEAIIRGTIEILNSFQPKLDVYYASYNYEDDLKRLIGCNVKIIKRNKKSRWGIRNILRKSLSLVGIKCDSFSPYDSTNWLSAFDVVFSIGGDMYTLNAKNGFDKSLPLFFENCVLSNKKYILWGASIGPFESNPEAKEFFKRHLKKASLIVAREKNTVEYLQKLGIEENVSLAPDPAFYVRETKLSTCEDNGFLNKNKIIGINLSPLSARYQYKSIDLAIEKQSFAIEQLVKNFDCSVVLIPHVFSSFDHDNDLKYLKAIYEKLSGKVPKEKLKIISDDLGFVGLKPFLRKCDAVVAARMHCAINAIAAGTPAVFLSYSSKSNGMAQMVYGSEEAVVKLIDFERITEWCPNFLKKFKKENLNINATLSFDFRKLFNESKAFLD